MYHFFKEALTWVAILVMALVVTGVGLGAL